MKRMYTLHESKACPMIYLFELREIEWLLRFYILYWALFESPIVLDDGINVVGVSNSVPKWPFSKLPKTSLVKWSASLYGPIEIKLILFLFIFGTYQALLFKRMSYLLHSSSLSPYYLLRRTKQIFFRKPKQHTFANIEIFRIVFFLFFSHT